MDMDVSNYKYYTLMKSKTKRTSDHDKQLVTDTGHNTSQMNLATEKSYTEASFLNGEDSSAEKE